MGQNSRQHWSAERYAEAAHFVPTLGAPVLELLAPEPGEHILDLGCGDGVLTERIAAAGATVVAVDAGWRRWPPLLTPACAIACI